MKKVIFFIIVLVFVSTGFLIPYFSSPKISLEYQQGVSSAVEPLGFLYFGIKTEDQKITTERCSDRGLQQILLQTYSWMFIPGPLVELCVYPDDPNIVKSAGTLKR